MREFETGATRDNDEGKLDFEGFLSPVVLYRYAQYMHEHRIQSDGELRPSDNWQKGIPQTAYMKSLMRHIIDLWIQYDCQPNDVDEEDERYGTTVNHKRYADALCAVIFNAMGMLFNLELNNEALCQ